jgi:hypothetical protein
MDTPDALILVQEHRAIEHLAHETHTSLAEVQQVFLSEYVKLSSDAHVRSFLPLLVVNRVRAMLHGRRAVPDGIPAPEKIAVPGKSSTSN